MLRPDELVSFSLTHCHSKLHVYLHYNIFLYIRNFQYSSLMESSTKKNCTIIFKLIALRICHTFVIIIFIYFLHNYTTVFMVSGLEFFDISGAAGVYRCDRLFYIQMWLGNGFI